MIRRTERGKDNTGMVSGKAANKEPVVGAHRADRLYPPGRFEDKIHKHRIIGKRPIAQSEIVWIMSMVDVIATCSQGAIHFGDVLEVARQRDGQDLGASPQVPDGKCAM